MKKAGRWLPPLETYIIPKLGQSDIEDINQHVLCEVLQFVWQVNASKRSRGRPKEKFSIDQKRASMILSICNNYESRMAITKWIQLVQKVEDAVGAIKFSEFSETEMPVERYFPKTVQLKSLENSVFRGMKLLGIKFNSYQKNNQYFSMVSRS